MHTPTRLEMLATSCFAPHRFALCAIRKLKLWSDPIARTEKVEVALSLKQSVWLPQEMSSTSPSAPVDGRVGGGSGRSRTSDGIGVSSSSSSPASAGRKRGYVFAPPYSVAASVVYQVWGGVNALCLGYLPYTTCVLMREMGGCVDFARLLSFRGELQTARARSFKSSPS